VLIAELCAIVSIFNCCASIPFAAVCSARSMILPNGKPFYGFGIDVVHQKIDALLDGFEVPEDVDICNEDTALTLDCSNSRVSRLHPKLFRGVLPARTANALLLERRKS